MNIVFQDALSEAMYVATRKANDASLKFFRDHFEQMLWGYTPQPNLERPTFQGDQQEPQSQMWECLISACRNDQVDYDDPENLTAWEFSWFVRTVKCDQFNQPLPKDSPENVQSYMHGGLVNHAGSGDDEPDWSIHT